MKRKLMIALLTVISTSAFATATVKGPLEHSADDVLVELGSEVVESIDKNRTNLDEFQKNKIKGLLLEVRDVLNNQDSAVSCDEIETFETFYSWARKEGFLPVDSRQMARAVSTEPGCNLYAQVYTISYTWAKQKWQRWDAHRIATMIANKQTLEAFKCFKDRYTWARQEQGHWDSYRYALGRCI